MVGGAPFSCTKVPVLVSIFVSLWLLSHAPSRALTHRGVLQVPVGPAMQFPKRYEDTDPAIAGSSYLKRQGQQLLKSIIQYHICSHSTPLQADQHTAASCGVTHIEPE